MTKKKNHATCKHRIKFSRSNFGLIVNPAHSLSPRMTGMHICTATWGIHNFGELIESTLRVIHCANSTKRIATYRWKWVEKNGVNVAAKSVPIRRWQDTDAGGTCSVLGWENQCRKKIANTASAGVFFCCSKGSGHCHFEICLFIQSFLFMDLFCERKFRWREKHVNWL